MNNWLDKTNMLLKPVHKQLVDSELADWNEFIANSGLMNEIKAVLPQGVQVKMIFDVDEIRAGGTHYFGCKQLFGDLEEESDDGQRSLVSGTMDASMEEGYSELYKTHGWRTLVYLAMDVRHSTNPFHPKSQPDMTADNPMVLYSTEPDALAPEEIHRIYLTSKSILSNMILRLGLTLINNSYERMKNVVHGALISLTDEVVLDFNSEAVLWFGADLKMHDRKSFSNVLPENLRHWVVQQIESGATGKDRYITKVIKLTRYDGSNIYAELTLRRTGSFENIQINELMRMGSERQPVNEMSDKMHFLLLQDVTDRWEAERLQQEMELARRMQVNLLPDKMPLSENLKIAARCRPASQVGGDVYDVVKLQDERLAVFAGDAVGHGIDSGLLAATTMGAYRAVINTVQEPVELLAELDKTLRQSEQTGFITASCLLFSADGREVKYALAGQPYPLLVRSGVLVEPDDLPESLPLGVNLPASYSSGVFQLQAGDLVVLVSDGVVELLNEDDEPFAESFVECLQTNSSEDVLTILNRIFQSIDEFKGNSDQVDDLTVVMIRVY